MRLEQALQENCVSWFRLNYLGYIIYHIPNGGYRNKSEAVRMKRMGVVPGIPDLHIPYTNGEFLSLYVELKAGSNRSTAVQVEVQEELIMAGNMVVEINSFEEFKQLVDGYMKTVKK